jgi:outer membrane receptor protein involved in Fe transport
MIKNKGMICLIAMMLFINVRAQQHQHDEKKDSLAHKHLAEINVQGAFNGKLNFPLQIIGIHEIQGHGVMTPANALHHVPGVSLSRDAIWATSINIRGFSEAKLLFMVDGDRMQTATDIAGALSTVDLGSLESIEIVKGAGSVLFGTGAMGGVVNFVTRRPAYSKTFDSDGSFSTGFSTVNNLWQNNLNVNFTNRDWYLALDGSYRTAQNTMTPAGLLNNSQFNDASWGLRGGMKNGDNQELLVNYNHFEAWNVGLPGGSAFPPTATVRYLGFARNQLSGEYIFTNLTPTVKELKLKAYTQNISRDVENIVNPTTAIFPGSLNVTSGLKATTDLYFNHYNTMTVGAEGWLRNHQTNRLKITTASDTILIGEQPTPNAKMLDIGIFAQYKWVLDPKYWTVNAGLRLDFIRTANDTAFKEVFKYKYVNGVKTEMSVENKILFSKGQKIEPAYSAHIDIEYKPTEKHHLILSLANAYRVASLEERFKYIDQAGILRVGDPDLKPEKGFFSNLNYTFKGRSLMIKTDFFANYLFDLITEELGTYTPASGPPVQAWINTNVDQALYLGGELALKWLITPDLEFTTHASYVYAVDALTKEHLPLIPALHGLAAFHYHFHEKLGAYAEMDWEYESEDEHGAGQEAHRHAIFNAGFHTVPRRLGFADMQFFGGVHNILNKAYEEHLSSLRGINRLEPGRNFFVKAKVSW